jgi:hypothetical protein
MKYIGKKFLSFSELIVNIRRFFDRLGPGLLFASMAIGTSHLVLSTKAGAVYGPLMIVPILLANLYPCYAKEPYRGLRGPQPLVSLPVCAGKSGQCLHYFGRALQRDHRHDGQRL